MLLEFEAEVIQWRGPAPYYFLAVPEPLCEDLRVASRDVSYGWGVIPVTVRIGGTPGRRRCSPRTAATSSRSRTASATAEDIAQDDVVEVVLTV